MFLLEINDCSKIFHNRSGFDLLSAAYKIQIVNNLVNKIVECKVVLKILIFEVIFSIYLL